MFCKKPKCWEMNKQEKEEEKIERHHDGQRWRKKGPSYGTQPSPCTPTPCYDVFTEYEGSQTFNSTQGHSADPRKSRAGPTSGSVFHTEHLSLPWSHTWTSGFGQGIPYLWCSCVVLPSIPIWKTSGNMGFAQGYNNSDG